jgi:hypothetical protein
LCPGCHLHGKRCRGGRRGAPTHPGDAAPAGERDPAGEYHGFAVLPAEEYHAAVRYAKRREGGGHALVRWVMIINGVDLSGGGEPYGAGGAYGCAASGQPVNDDVLYSPQVAP